MPSRHRRGLVFSSHIPLQKTIHRRGAVVRSPSIPSISVKASTNSAKPHQATTVTNSRTLSHSAVVTADGLTMTLPVPPSINHQYATVNGRRLLSSTGRAYKAQVGRQVWVMLAQSPCAPSFRERIRSGPLALSIRFFFSTSLRRDLDGGLKIAQDAICEGLDVNDNRIIETHLYKHVDKTNPRIEVSLSCLPVSPHQS